MINIFKTGPDDIVHAIDKIEKGCWINLIDPDSDEIDLVSKNTGLDRDFLKAALDKEESSRFEVESGQMLVLLDVPIMDIINTTSFYSTIPLGIILNDDYIVTIVLKENNIIGDFYEQKIKTFYTYKKSRFILQILLRIDKYYLSFLKQIDKANKNIEKRLHKSLKNQDLSDIMELEKSLVHFSISLKANQITLERMAKLEIMHKYPEDEDLLEDVIIENRQAIEMTNIYRNILTSIINTMQLIISNNQNILIKRLISLIGILSIPVIIGIFFGMNVPIPWGNFSFAFISIICITIIIFIMVLIIILKWKKD